MKRLKFFALFLVLLCIMFGLCGCKDAPNSTETYGDISATESHDHDYFLPGDEDANELIIIIPNSNQSDNGSVDDSSSGVDEIVFGETTPSDNNQSNENVSDDNESDNDSSQDDANSSENESSLDDDSLVGWNRPVF